MSIRLWSSGTSSAWGARPTSSHTTPPVGRPGKTETIKDAEEQLRSHDVELKTRDDPACIALVRDFIDAESMSELLLEKSIA